MPFNISFIKMTFCQRVGFSENIFFWKNLQILPVSITFAAVMALTNVSISITNINLHILLRTTDIIWVVVFAFIIQKERPTILTAIACISLFFGIVLISPITDDNWYLKNAWVQLVFNLLSALSSGLMMVLLRRACVILRFKIPTMTVAEITLIKMFQTFIFLLPFPFIFEPKAFNAIIDSTLTIKLLVGAGVLITMGFQTTVVGLSAYSLATTVGIIANFKIIPQIIFGFLWEVSFCEEDKTESHKFDFSLFHSLGLGIVVLATLFYSYLRWRAHKKNQAHKSTDVGVF